MLSKLPVVHRKSKVTNSNNNSINSSSVGSGSNKSADNRLPGYEVDGMVCGTRHETGSERRWKLEIEVEWVRSLVVSEYSRLASVLGWTDNASRFHQSRAHFQCLPAAYLGKNYADRSEMSTSHAVDSGSEWSELDCWYYRCS
ncbi:hypothetical protein X801_05325, partial [Opisthorchis viverrini]